MPIPRGLETESEEAAMAQKGAGEEVAWRVIRYGTPVVSSEGETAGTVREVLGSDAEDIFHGLRVELSGSRREVLLPADAVLRIGVGQIDTGLSRAAVEALPAYAEHATYHLASVGWLRRHVGWKEDSKSDEEPG
jgi:hypothetical protein